MPDDYYVSKYSGEEIDERLTAAHNAVRYDAAQTLTDAQKTQARANIAAAPDGFGLGTINRVVTDFDTVKMNGWYYGNAGTAHAPDSVNNWSVRVTNLGNNSEVCVQDAYALINVSRYLHCRRLMYVSTATQNNPWEWVDPPMYFGVEYRTTERYLVKPVYYKVVNFGNLPDTAGKSVAHGIANVQYMIDVTLQCTNGSTFTHNANELSVYASREDVYIKTLINLSNYAVYATLRYTKTTD